MVFSSSLFLLMFLSVVFISDYFIKKEYSNALALCADRVFSYHITVMDYGMAWIGALAYTFQIYYDFSGYSDMANGLGKMFGFTIPENFNYPFIYFQF